MNSRKTRKAAAVALIALAGLGVRTASAAGADFSAQELFIGSSAAEQCNSSQVTVDYDVAYDAALKGYGVSAAQLSGLDAQCQGYDVTVSLSGPGGGHAGRDDNSGERCRDARPGVGRYAGGC